MDTIDGSALQDLLVYALIAGLIFGLIAGKIRQAKGGSFGGGSFLGFILASSVS